MWPLRIYSDDSDEALQWYHSYIFNYSKESSGIHQQRGKKTCTTAYMPSEQGGKQQQLHHPHAKHHGDRNLAWHELTTHTPKKSTEGERRRPPYKLIHADIAFRP
jgi:hypothetical protein